MRQDWLDRLVDLQVLAASGDVAAARRAEDWIAHDPEAHTIWHTIADDCARVRGLPPGGDDARPSRP